MQKLAVNLLQAVKKTIINPPLELHFPIRTGRSVEFTGFGFGLVTSLGQQSLFPIILITQREMGALMSEAQ